MHKGIIADQVWGYYWQVRIEDLAIRQFGEASAWPSSVDAEVGAVKLEERRVPHSSMDASGKRVLGHHTSIRLGVPACRDEPGIGAIRCPVGTRLLIGLCEFTARGRVPGGATHLVVHLSPGGLTDGRVGAGAEGCFDRGGGGRRGHVGGIAPYEVSVLLDGADAMVPAGARRGVGGSSSE